MTKKQNVCIISFPGTNAEFVADFIRMVNATDFEKKHDISMIVTNEKVEMINLKDLLNLLKGLK